MIIQTLSKTSGEHELWLLKSFNLINKHSKIFKGIFIQNEVCRECMVSHVD